MNTQIKNILKYTVLFFVAVNANADAGFLNFTNRAYVHAIPGAPNPVSDVNIAPAVIVYADKAYGQAIYSYPSNVAMTATGFNVEYIDTAYGQAIYSYHNNNPVKLHLNLTEISDKVNAVAVMPAALTHNDLKKRVYEP